MNMTSKLNIPKIISIEGNIGSGKSTLISYLEQHFKHNPRICFIKEPVDEWNTIKDERGITILEKYYENQKKYSFSFQIMAYITRLSVLNKALKQNYDIIITERCIYSDKMIFAKMLYDNNIMEEIEYKIYTRWFNEFIKDIPKISLIYIKTDPHIAKTRIEKRARIGENISYEYLLNCHQYHESWIQNHTYDVLTLDGNQDIISNNSYLLDNIYKINNYIEIPSYINIDKEYLLRFDGGSRGNPGICGAGYVIYYNEIPILEGYKFVSFKNTSNYAEYIALILGLEEAIKLGIQLINIQGDSVLIINQIKEVFACESSNLKPLKKKAQSLLNLFDSYKIDYISRSQNIYADKLANKGMDSCTDSLEHHNLNIL